MPRNLTRVPLLPFLLIIGFLSGLGAQTLPLKVLPKPARALLADYVLIPGGDFVKNLYLGADSLQFQFPKRVAVDSFYMSKYEVTVEEYVRFFRETGDLQNKYDSAVWTKDYPYSYNEPMTRNYFLSPFFRQYPALGITWDQAMRYCQWKSNAVNALLENTGYQVEITLPADAQWQYAACGPEKQIGVGLNTGEQWIFPWGSNFLQKLPNKPGCHPHCNSGYIRTPQDFVLMSYPYDGGLYTVEVEHFEPNGYGLYQMSGNVAEWTSDNFSADYERLEEAQQKYKNDPKLLNRYTPAFAPGQYDDYKIVKGGSWADEPFYMQIGVVKIQHPEKASSTVGFRPILRIFRK